MNNNYETIVKKDLRNGWRAETVVRDINNYDWLITTLKRYNGQIQCNAQACQVTDIGFTFVIFQDPSITLYQTKQRATGKTIETVHEMGLIKFDELIASDKLPTNEYNE